jgi:hypothetical protein
MVGAGGNYNFANYGAIAGTTTSFGLVDSRSWLANGFYAHRFRNRHWTGLAYNFQRLTFDVGSRADVNRILWFYSLPIGSHMLLSVWAGPEYSKSFLPVTLILPGTLSARSHWFGAGGMGWTWQGTRTSFRAGYGQQTTDGSGLAEAVKMQSADGELLRQLTARWSLSVGAAYARNNPLNSAIAAGAFHSWMGSGGFQYRLTDNLGLGLRYGREQVRQRYAAATDIWSNRNRVWFSLSYSFTRPLGR